MSNPLSLTVFKTKLETNKYILVDLRHQNDFIEKHVPNSLFVGIDGPFEKWIQLVVPNKNARILLVLPQDKITSCLEFLKTLGYTNIIGFLEGGISNWSKFHKTDAIKSISPKEYKSFKENTKSISVDVRKESEFEKDHIPNSSLIPLKIDKDFLSNFINSNHYFLFCGGGYRSVIAISYLKKNGKQNFTNIEKGFKGIREVISDII